MVYLEKSTDQQPVYIPKDEDTGFPGGQSLAILQSKDWEIHQNGYIKVVPDAGYDGISGGSIVVYVNADTATTFEHLSVEENGIYVPSGNSAYSAVTVDVPTVNNQDKTVTITQDVGQGTSFISAHTTVSCDEGYTGLGDVDVDVKIRCINDINAGSYTGNGSYEVTADSLGFPGQTFRKVRFTVNVPQTGSTASTTSLTVTENNRRYYPYQYNVDAFDSVDVRIDTTPYYNSGYTSGYTDGYASGTTDGYASGYTSGETAGYESGYTEGYASGETVGYSSGYTDGYESGYTSGETAGYESGYTSGHTDGYNEGYASGSTEGYDEGYASGYTQGEEDGFASGYTSGQTDGYSSGYTEGYDEGYTSGSTQGYDDGYASGYTTGYQSGYTRGDQEGYASGITYQKSLLATTAITANGTYTRENGWNEVSVNVPNAPIVTLTQAQYDALDPKDPTTIYLIKD